VSLASQVLLGLALGIAVGVFFGELVAPVGIVGQAFILLLQMTVLPYVAISLIKALGSLSPRDAVALARKAGGFLVLLWAIALASVLLMPIAFPAWESASFFSTTLVEKSPPFDFLGLFIPANPFRALADNVVPAVVVFSIALGIALIASPEKAPIVRACATLTDALGAVAGFVVRLAPVGVFGIAAEAAGTMDVEEIRGLQVYVVAYVALSLFLAFWVLPGLVATLTPFRNREIIAATRDALLTAFATGNVFVVLAVLTERSKELVRRHAEQSDDAEAFVEVVVPTAFTLPSAGKLLALSFVLFAGWLSGFAVAPSQYPAFAISGLFTFFGNTLVAIPFLLDAFRIPADTTQLFVIADNVVGGRFGSLVAAVHIVALALLSASAIGGLVRVRWVALVRFVAITAIAGPLLVLGVRLFFEGRGHQYEGYQLFVQRGLLREGVPTRLLDGPPAALPSVDRAVPTLDRIRRRGTLRAGYRADSLPHAFQNQDGALVGYDIELMHELARDLGVGLELVKVGVDDLPGLLAAGYLDTATGLAVTPDRMGPLSFSDPYLDETLAFVVEDHRRDEFSSRAAVRAQPSPRIAAPRSPYYVAKLEQYLPRAQVVAIDSPRSFFRGQLEGVDALLYSAEAGSAWSLVYPQFSVAVPHPDLLRIPFALPVARGDAEMADFVSSWLGLKERDGTLDRLFDYWIRGRDERASSRRWSVLRDVLGWLE
jgi:Na+/H+-dicarboxylate symporter